MLRSYSGSARPTTLAAALGGTVNDLTITCANLANYPTGLAGPFYIVINRNQPTEEKILCASRIDNVITVYTSGGSTGRGADGTTISSHSLGSEVEHIFTATDAYEANFHVNDTTTAHGLTIANVVTLAGTQTLTNKTMSGSSNTFSNIPASAVTGLATDYATLTTAQTLTNKTLTAPVSTVATSAQTASYTLVAADASKIVEMSNANANTLTVPTNLSVPFAVGTQIVVLQTGAGQTTIAGASGVTVNGTPGLKLRAQWSIGTLIKRAENTWVLVGDTVA